MNVYGFAWQNSATSSCRGKEYARIGSYSRMRHSGSRTPAKAEGIDSVLRSRPRDGEGGGGASANFAFKKIIYLLRKLTEATCDTVQPHVTLC